MLFPQESPFIHIAWSTSEKIKVKNDSSWSKCLKLLMDEKTYRQGMKDMQKMDGYWMSGPFVYLPLCCQHFLSCKCCLLFTSAAYIKIHIRLDSFIVVNNMNPDQTAPKGAV